MYITNISFLQKAKKKKKTGTVDTNFILHNIYFIIISRQNKIQMTKETWMNVLQ